MKTTTTTTMQAREWQTVAVEAILQVHGSRGPVAQVIDRLLTAAADDGAGLYYEEVVPGVSVHTDGTLGPQWVVTTNGDGMVQTAEEWAAARDSRAAAEAWTDEDATWPTAAEVVRLWREIRGLDETTMAAHKMYDVFFGPNGQTAHVLISVNNKQLAWTLVRACASQFGPVDKFRYWGVHERSSETKLASPIIWPSETSEVTVT